MGSGIYLFLPLNPVNAKAGHSWQYVNYPNLQFLEVEGCVCLAGLTASSLNYQYKCSQIIETNTGTLLQNFIYRILSNDIELHIHLVR
jgi:hypothetical protein